MTKTRAFIAVNLPEDIKTELAIWLRQPKKTLNGNIKWVNPENFHLTLHFLRYLDEKKLSIVKTILERNVKTHDPIVFEINRFGCFPTESRPRVLFIDCHELNGNYLKSLQTALGRDLKKIGIKIDSRPWQMHITFARLRKPDHIPLSKFQTFKKLKFTVNSIDLMKSELRRTGPIYSIIKKFLISNFKNHD